MTIYSDVLFEEIKGNNGDLGIIKLNRPQALNALDHGMIKAIHAQLKTWASAKYIKAVIIRKSEGRAFCAGGDLRLTYERYQTQDPAMFQFFRDEYALNAYIFHYHKPYIALLDGITMGGGVGLSIHGSHRIGTEQLLFAMPETGIGFFPDVGGSYFLPRLKGYMGYYLGLTGARIQCDDSLAIGIVQHNVPSAALDACVSALAEQPFSDNSRESVTHIIQSFETRSPSPLMQHENDIETCFSQPTLPEIISTLQKSTNSFCQDTLKQLDKKSPTSLYVALQAMQQGSHLEFDACMKNEYRLAKHFLRGGDFIEGIRAVIIDKNYQPIWHPAKVNEVNQAAIAAFFDPVTDELSLPV